MRKLLEAAGIAGAFLVGGVLTSLAVCNALLQAPPVRRAIRTQAAGSNPSAAVTMGGILFVPPAGCIVRDLSVQTSPDTDRIEILGVPWARIRPDWTALARGRFVAREIVLEAPRASALIENDLVHLPLFGTVSLSPPGVRGPVLAPAGDPAGEAVSPDPTQSSEASASPKVPSEHVETAEAAPTSPVDRDPAPNPKRKRRAQSTVLRVRNARFSLLAPAAGLPPLCEIEGIEAGRPLRFLTLSKASSGAPADHLAIRTIRILGKTVAHNLSSPLQWTPDFRLRLSELRGTALDGELMGQAAVGLLEPGIPFAATASVKGAYLAAAANIPPELGLGSARSESVFHITGFARKPDTFSGHALVRIIESPPSALPGGAALRGHLRARLWAGTAVVDDAYFSSPAAEVRARGFATLGGQLRFSIRCFLGDQGQNIVATARSASSPSLPAPSFKSLEGRDDTYLDFTVSGAFPHLRTDLLGEDLALDTAITRIRSIRTSPGSASRQDIERGVSPPEP